MSDSENRPVTTLAPASRSNIFDRWYSNDMPPLRPDARGEMAFRTAKEIQAERLRSLKPAIPE
jgi:hypothetical protein